MWKAKIWADFKVFGLSAMNHWKSLITGSLVAALLAVVAYVKLALPGWMGGVWVLSVAGVWASFEAFRDQLRRSEQCETQIHRRQKSKSEIANCILELDKRLKELEGLKDVHYVRQEREATSKLLEKHYSIIAHHMGPDFAEAFRYTNRSDMPTPRTRDISKLSDKVKTLIELVKASAPNPDR